MAQNDTLKIQNLMDEAYSFEQSQPSKALQLYQKTFKLSLKANYKDGAYKSLLYRGIVYSDKGEYDSALSYYSKCVDYSKKAELPIGVAKGYANMANMYQFKGNYSKAANYYVIAIKIFEKINDSVATSQSYQNLSAIYTQFKNEKLEFFYLKKAAQYLPKSNYLRLGLLYGDIGIGLLNQNKFPEALRYFNKANALTKKESSNELLFHVTRNFGEYYQFKNDYTKAISFYEKALKIAPIAVNAAFKNDLIYVLSDLYLKTNNYSKAVDFANLSLALAKKAGSIDLEYKSLKRLSVIYNEQNQPERAYQFLEKSYRIKDSIFSEENSKELAFLQTQFETEKKDKSIVEQQITLKEQELNLLKNQKQQQLYFISIILLTLLSIGIWYFFKQRQKLKNQEIETLKQNQEISNLEAIIDGEEKERKRIAQELHDGLNGDLSAIKYRLSTLEESGLSAIDTENLTKVITMIDESCAQVRSISHNLMPASILEYGLIESIRAYCMKINTSENFKITFQSYGDYIVLSKKTETVIYRIIQELTTNILKHAKATEAMVQFNFRDDEFFITVEDNGIGFDKAKISEGIGHKNLQTRIDFLNAQLNVASSTSGTSYTISIDLNKVK
jgi:signal transduction histidine kinase